MNNDKKLTPEEIHELAIRPIPIPNSYTLSRAAGGAIKSSYKFSERAIMLTSGVGNH